MYNFKSKSNAPLRKGKGVKEKRLSICSNSTSRVGHVTFFKQALWGTAIRSFGALGGLRNVFQSGPLGYRKKVLSALLLDQVSSELSAAGAKRDVRFLQLPVWLPPDDPFQARRPKAGQGLVSQIFGYLAIWIFGRVRQTCLSGVSLKRASKIQLRGVDLRSVGHSSQKLSAENYFRKFPLLYPLQYSRTQVGDLPDMLRRFRKLF